MVQTTITITGGIDEVVQTIRQLATPQPDIAATAISILPPALEPAAPQRISQAEPSPASQPARPRHSGRITRRLPKPKRRYPRPGRPKPLPRC